VYVARSDLSGIQLDVDLRERRITADYVADALREAIHRGELADGAVLNQAAIATHFGVSRVPVREAMRQLQAEGLIETRAHRLAVVRGLDLERLVEVYDLRALLEGYLIERAVPSIDEAQLRELHALEKEMRKEDDHARWLELNARFHRMLYEPSGRETTLELIDQLRARAERYVRLWSRGSGIHRPLEAGSDHARILELVEQGDGPGAREAIERHIANTRDRVVAARRAADTAADGAVPSAAPVATPA
jgi:DNA-binding GntR family transcriptional regulator